MSSIPSAACDQAPLQSALRLVSRGRSERLPLARYITKTGSHGATLRIAGSGDRWQPKIGYAYLTDEHGLQLRRIPAGREYLREFSGGVVRGERPRPNPRVRMLNKSRIETVTTDLVSGPLCRRTGGRLYNRHTLR